VEDRRAIDSFFLRDVDRDKTSCTAVRESSVGGAVGAGARGSGERARVAQCGHAPVAVPTAYYAMLYAARAALSEGDRHTRSHTGTWALFARSSCSPASRRAAGARGQRAQARREARDYAAESFDPSEAQQLVATAERFVAAIATLTS
jgi:uncharacterized protein (UPF0332 family)